MNNKTEKRIYCEFIQITTIRNEYFYETRTEYMSWRISIYELVTLLLLGLNTIKLKI